MNNTAVEVRLALKVAGYEPVACIGKKAFQEEWTTTRLQDTPEEIAKWGGGNTGIATRYTPGYDIDIDLPEPAVRMEEVARDWFDGRGIIPARFGQRSDTRVAGKNISAAEFLGRKIFRERI